MACGTAPVDTYSGYYDDELEMNTPVEVCRASLLAGHAQRCADGRSTRDAVQELCNVDNSGTKPLKALYKWHLRFDTDALANHATRQALEWWASNDRSAAEGGSGTLEGTPSFASGAEHFGRRSTG